MQDPSQRALPRDVVFPLVEAFGYACSAKSKEAADARERRYCRFSGTPCEKFRQYGFGYCSVTYSAADDANTRQTYAVCDHRLDGEPIRLVIADHFGTNADSVRLVPEVVLSKPRMSFDYVGITTSTTGDIADAIAIETQAIDIRGGGVGPAWRAWSEGSSERWREYFSAEAATKGRKDTVAYGVNMANIFKRLGLQVAVKGSFLKGIGVPLYIVMQHRPFEYLRRRIQFVEGDSPWDITFMTFDYTGSVSASGEVEFAPVATVRTSLGSYLAALTGTNASDRSVFLERVKRKAGLA
jgi:Restriction endonuclease NotI